MNNNQKLHQTFSTKTIILGMLVIVWMSLIFIMSGQTAAESSELSSGIAQRGAEVIARIVPDANVDTLALGHLLRKGAHFVAYFILGLLVIVTLLSSGMEKRRALVMAMMICIAYATSDEIHQYFVPGRGPQLSDVMIDNLGSGAGLLVSWLACDKCASRVKRL